MKTPALTLSLAVLVIGLVACGPKRPPTSPPREGLGTPPQPQLSEWVVLHLEPLSEAGSGRDDCKLMQSRPADVHAVPGSWIRFVLVGGCRPDTPVGISTIFTDQNGNEVRIIAEDLAAENEKDRKAGKKEIDIDPEQVEDKDREQIKIKFNKNRRLLLKIRNNAPHGRYRYQILVNDKPLIANSLAERGVLVVCPDWPCSGRGF